MGRAIMVQGTSSHVGKSVLAAALCRIFRQDGVNVAPFKAQNMSNNSYVTAGGGEMGRSQVVQAAAARVEPTVAMNPVLLKPEAGHRSQIIVNGRPWGAYRSAEWTGSRPRLWDAARDALDSLLADYEIVVIEGAGSPVELNLKASDIVNMRVARHACAPVLLVGDIDRGGVFASLLGTLELLAPEERALVRGLVINRFRGSRAMLEPLPEMIAERTGAPVLGVIPYVYDLRLPEEDAVALEQSPGPGREVRSGAELRVAVVSFPHVSNTDDFEPLARVPGVSVQYAVSPSQILASHLVVLPGTKSTISDLRWMRARGLDRAVAKAREGGAAVIGVCGGYQMLGMSVADPSAVEGGRPDREAGLGLLPVSTEFASSKTTRRVTFRLNGGPGMLAGAGGIEGRGYEIHMGQTTPVGGASPRAAMFLRTDGRCERHGSTSVDGWVIGAYVHGLFGNPNVLRVLVGNAASRHGLPPPGENPFSLDDELDRLAAVVRENLDMERIRSLAGL